MAVENRWVLLEAGVCTCVERGKEVHQRYKRVVVEWTRHGAATYNTVTVMDYTASLKVARRADPENSHYKRKNHNYEWWGLITAIVVAILQNIQTLSHYIAYLFPTLCFYLLIYCLFAFSRAASTAYEGSQARGLIGAMATGLRQSHSNTRSKPFLQPTPQLTATPDR